MKTTPYQVTQLSTGLLYVMAKPIGGDYLADECQHIASLGISQLVSLLEPQEAAKLALHDEQQQVEQAGMVFVSYPIKDRGLPNSIFSFSQLTRQLHQQIVCGKHTVIHCRAGIGRTGIVAAGVLLHAGYKPQAAFNLVTQARGLQVPDTEQQYDWLVKNYRDIISEW